MIPAKTARLWRTFLLLITGCLLLSGCFLFVRGNFEDPPLVLILPSEAEMAGLPIGKMLGFRSRQQGPRILVNSPKIGEVLSPPVAIDIRFVPREEIPVDIGTLKVVYVKLLKIDITDRVAPYAGPDGIRVPKADLPPGEHTLILSIADRSGKTSSQVIRLSIQEKT